MNPRTDRKKKISKSRETVDRVVRRIFKKWMRRAARRESTLIIRES